MAMRAYRNVSAEEKGHNRAGPSDRAALGVS